MLQTLTYQLVTVYLWNHLTPVLLVLSSPEHCRHHCRSHNCCSPDPSYYCHHPLLLYPCPSQEEVREGNLQRDKVTKT